MSLDILTDELKHGTLYNLIYTEILSGSTNEDTGPLERTPDEWIHYTKFLVNEGLKDVEREINSRHILQEYILMGVLVGQGYSPEKAFETVENWERTGESKILKRNNKLDHSFFQTYCEEGYSQKSYQDIRAFLNIRFRRVLIEVLTGCK